MDDVLGVVDHEGQQAAAADEAGHGQQAAGQPRAGARHGVRARRDHVVAEVALDEHRAPGDDLRGFPGREDDAWRTVLEGDARRRGAGERRLRLLGVDGIVGRRKAVVVGGIDFA